MPSIQPPGVLDRYNTNVKYPCLGQMHLQLSTVNRVHTFLYPDTLLFDNFTAATETLRKYVYGVLIGK